MSLSQAALRIAQGEIGNGEEGRNNRGFHINRYRQGRTPVGSGAWCATFIHFCLYEGWCGLRKRPKHFPFSYTASANKLAHQLARYGTEVNFQQMQPGDILLWDRRGGKHIDICSSTTHSAENELTHFTTIDGNKGPFPAVVAEFNHIPYPRPLKVIRV